MHTLKASKAQSFTQQKLFVAYGQQQCYSYTLTLPSFQLIRGPAYLALYTYKNMNFPH